MSPRNPQPHFSLGGVLSIIHLLLISILLIPNWLRTLYPDFLPVIMSQMDSLTTGETGSITLEVLVFPLGWLPPYSEYVPALSMFIIGINSILVGHFLAWLLRPICRLAGLPSSSKESTNKRMESNG